MPQILPPSAWVEYRGFPNAKTYHESEIHFALVKGHDGIVRKCAVKFIDLNKGPGLICEGLGWILAKASGVNVPSFAAVLRVPLPKLATSMPIPSYLNSYTEYPAWCVEVVEGKSIAQVNQWIFWLTREFCLRAKNTPVMASFDFWADNQDRNFGNVIRSKEGKFIAIDHEVLLHELLYVPNGIQFRLNSLLVEAEARMSADRFLRFKCEMAAAAQEHEAAMNNIRTAGSAYLRKIIPDPTQASSLWNSIESFLDARSQLGWMSNRLGVTV